MYRREIKSSDRAAADEDIGENSDSGGDSDISDCAPSPRRHHPTSMASSRFDSKSPLYDFSSLAGQLPLKKGLSKYYQGKSQSFTSLSEVKSLEDLPKKEEFLCTKKIKPCKSYAALNQSQMALTLLCAGTCAISKPKKMTPPSMAFSTSLTEQQQQQQLS
ncbi:hypothetical protein KSP39_PZI007556 [Platanthera zijinensis]|uniref:Oxidative stress 3 n=1 Tax=Platanthera zijinensis TaxID=2320716 RepID=A0AAP0G901_9ASPA